MVIIEVTKFSHTIILERSPEFYHLFLIRITIVTMATKETMVTLIGCPILKRLFADFLPRRTWFVPRAVHMGFLWTKWHWNRFLFECFGFHSQYHSTAAQYSLVYHLGQYYSTFLCPAEPPSPSKPVKTSRPPVDKFWCGGWTLGPLAAAVPSQQLKTVVMKGALTLHAQQVWPTETHVNLNVKRLLLLSDFN